jgi:hypothetical protein
MDEQIEDDSAKIISKDEIADKIQDKLAPILKGDGKRKYVRFIMAALGSIPWVGSFIGAAAALEAENEQQGTNELHRLWFEEHKGKINELAYALFEILSRLEKFGEEIQERIESPQYLDLVKKAFRSWDQADTQEKRDLLRKLLTRSGATKLCPDDLVRLFIDWINKYHEAHFLVIKAIYQNPGITRGEIWDKIHGTRPRDDSAEADLFKLLIDDLTLGHVIRQKRQANTYGQFEKKKPSKKPTSSTMLSPFDAIEPYELTDLGKQFVHYTMEEVVTQITE